MAPKKFSALLLGGFPWKRLPIPQEALPFGEGTVLDRSLAAYREADARSIVVVLGPADPVLTLAVQPHLKRIKLVGVEEEAAGMGTYVSRGLEALDDRGSALAIGFTDMPLLSSDLIAELFAAFRDSGKPIGVPTCQGVLGHPLFLQPALTPQLEHLSGSKTHRDLIMAKPDDVEVIHTAHAAVLRTIEVFADYREMLAAAGLEMRDLRAYRAELRALTGEEEPPEEKVSAQIKE